MVEANHLESIIWLFIWDGFLKTLKTILEFENSKGFFSHEFSSWLTGSSWSQKAVDIYCVSHCAWSSSWCFYSRYYQQVIPEWLGSILKRAAFLLSRIYYYKATTQIFDGGRRHKSKFRKLKWISKNFSQFVWLQYSDRQTNFIDAHMVSFSDLYKQFIMFIT